MKKAFYFFTKQTLNTVLCTLGCLIFLCATQTTQAQTTWTIRTSAADNSWTSVTYGNGLFVAVANSGIGNRVMTSPDGITWTICTSAADNNWNSVTYGNGLFVAVASTGTGNRVMTSPDGINWTIRTSAADNSWNSVTYGNGLFVAVASTGTSRAMTSPDGINWTIRNGLPSSWSSVTYGNGLFVAVANSGANRAMTSPDGITWTNPTIHNGAWNSVTYGNGLFVAVAISSIVNLVATSPDGINWTNRTAAANNPWSSVTYGNGLFVAVAQSGTGNRVMTSPNGITWTSRTSAADNTWRGITYGNGLFVAVAQSGTGNRVMTSPTDAPLPVELVSFSGKNTEGGNLLTWQTANEVNNKGFEIERLMDNGQWIILGFVNAKGKAATYEFIDNQPFTTAYYRLRQIDNDGKETLSKVISVERKGKGKLALYPNPVANTLSILTDTDAMFQILNIYGQQVLSGKTAQRIDVSALPQGTYVLKVGAEQVKFMKQ